MKRYVLGFAFSKDKTHVALIEKQRPDWQKGFYNGIGGKIEADEFDHDAMVREFKEETGVDTEAIEWDKFANMLFEESVMGGKAKVSCFRMFSDVVFYCNTVEDEKIQIFCLDPKTQSEYPLLYNYPCIKNLNILIPLAMDEDFIMAELTIL